MSKKKGGKRISDNPSNKEMKDLLPSLDVLGDTLDIFGVKGDKVEEFQRQVNDIMKQADIIHLPDRFNEAFGDRGWVAVGNALSVDMMKEALDLYDEGKADEAEDVLVGWFSKENIELFAILRARRFHKAELREEQLKEALRLFLEERYIAAVPLILIACDGFASDVAPVSPFEKDADLSCFDSITGHSTTLPSLIKLLTKGVRKSRDDEIDLPLRHGILHGRSLGYANKKVCAKAWLLMMALVDWAIDKLSEEERKGRHEKNKNLSFIDSVKHHRKVQEDQEAIDNFEPYEIAGPPVAPFSRDGPESVVMDFLTGWKDKNYGKMGRVVVNLTNKPINKMAGEMRNMAEIVELLDYEIKLIRYSSVARCVVRFSARAKTLKKEIVGDFDLILLRFTSAGDVAMPTDEGCRWLVQQNCIYNVMNEKFANDA